MSFGACILTGELLVFVNLKKVVGRKLFTLLFHFILIKCWVIGFRESETSSRVVESQLISLCMTVWGMPGPWALPAKESDPVYC